MRTVIACLAGHEWSNLPSREQHLMERLARTADIVYVNPLLQDREWPYPDRTVQLSPSLWVHEPRSVPGARRLGWARWLTYGFLARQLAGWTKDRTFVLWLCSPRGLPLVELLRPDRVVYDMATLAATPRTGKVRDERERLEIETLAHLERSLFAECDLTICASEPLVEWAARRTRRVHLIQSGCDRPRYAAPASTVDAGLRAGYFGPLGPELDIELLASVARARPDWTIELAGGVPDEVDTSVLASLPNVTLTGAMPIEAMPAKLASFDVCLLPLRENDFTYHSSPMPAVDYLAAGKPIVSTPIGQMEEWKGLVSIARGGQHFVSAIDDARHASSASDISRRRTWAARNTWDVRVAKVADALDQIGVSLSRESAARAMTRADADTAGRAAAPSARLCSPLETTFAPCR